jgi:hypothetical protein
MLMGHVDGAALPDLRSEPAAWTATMARFAEAQRVLAEDLVVLAKAGVPAAPLDALAAAIPDLLADDDLLLLGRPGGLTAAEARSVRSRQDVLIDAAGALGAGGVPPSLDHGDLSASQVLIGAMGPVVLDWSDATVTHPFLGAASFLANPDDLPAGLEADLEAAYLGPWAGRGDPVALRADLRNARRVHPLHMTALYADRILPGLDQPWEMARMVPWFLRSLLRDPAILAP